MCFIAVNRTQRTFVRQKHGYCDRNVVKNDGRLVVKHLHVDQEVVDSNATHGRNYFMLCARSSGLRSPFLKGCRLSGGRDPHIQLWLKIRICIRRRLAVVSECTDARIENDTRHARHNHYTHELRITPHTCMHNTTCDNISKKQHVYHVYEKQENAPQWKMAIDVFALQRRRYSYCCGRTFMLNLSRRGHVINAHLHYIKLNAARSLLRAIKITLMVCDANNLSR